jgi:hypothetical protein
MTRMPDKHRGTRTSLTRYAQQDKEGIIDG